MAIDSIQLKTGRLLDALSSEVLNWRIAVDQCRRVTDKEWEHLRLRFNQVDAEMQEYLKWLSAQETGSKTKYGLPSITS